MVANQSALADVSLEDKWTVEKGRVFLNGTQAIARIMLSQSALDVRRGLKTAGFISGYRGSPLGNVDATLWSIERRLEDARIRFLPGINEDMAATAVRGTQQLDAFDHPDVDGVFAAWYGKGPGVDRSGDALKHGNLHGSHPNGGVLVLYGDDHGGKSSSIAHHSEQAMTAALIPSLYPACVGEIIEYGLLGFALSRYSGAWVGLKLVNEVAEQTATVDIDVSACAPVLPETEDLPPEGVHARPRSFGPLREEQIATEHRLPLVQAFVRANRIDRVTFDAPVRRLGLVSAGKSHGDTMQALSLLGLDEETAGSLGISLFKVGCIWPLEPEALRAFARDQAMLFFIEEKQAFIEPQAAALLINQTQRPRLLGKYDETGKALLPLTLQLDPVRVAIAIADRLSELGIESAPVYQAADAMRQRLAANVPVAALPKRSPYFCSGCPHSRSTRIPDGSVSLTGIGCHTMVNFVRPDIALPPTHMGGEGGNWIGLAPYTATRHVFQNMGDGTYYHSGLMAIRAAIASGVNITYKILYNDAVAMTGGQPVDGPISVLEIARQVRDEGVTDIRILSETPERWGKNAGLPGGVRVYPRDMLDRVQREMREVQGCSVLIYEQTCAAEKRRRRKRGRYPDPARRLFIAQEVCESCGDCSQQSSCVSIVPVETELGPKRAIDQSSCNKDFSCLDGFCPSFLTVEGANPRKPEARAHGIDPALLENLPAPARADGPCNLMIAGIGGTGVITVAAVIGMAAHIDGMAASMFDMTGLSQKNGAVFSHVRLATDASSIHAQKLGLGEADLLLAMDAVAALADDARSTVSFGHTAVLVNNDVAPTVAFQFDRDSRVESDLLLRSLKQAAGPDSVEDFSASALSLSLFGDTIGANMMVVGFALQRGLLPISAAAVEKAIALNGTAVSLNRNAFRLGRLMAVNPGGIAALAAPVAPKAQPTLEDVVANRSARLVSYQDEELAERYRTLVAKVAEAERRVWPGEQVLTLAVAHSYSRVLAIKDEYEVARLLVSDELWARLTETFEAGGQISYNLAPPFLPGRTANGRPRKRRFDAKRWRPLLRLLAKARWLRKTPFDPFALAAERRAERALVTHYEDLVSHLLSRIETVDHATAAALLRRVDEVRGFGPVKLAALATFQDGLAAAHAALDSSQVTNRQAV